MVLVAAGCGGGSTAPSAAAECVPSGDVAADIGTGGIAIAARDDRFEPVCIRLTEPGTTTLVVRNDGRHPHNLTVGERQSVAVDAGQVGILEVEVGPGGLPFVCTIHPGMEGELRVER